MSPLSAAALEDSGAAMIGPVPFCRMMGPVAVKVGPTRPLIRVGSSADMDAFGTITCAIPTGTVVERAAQHASDKASTTETALDARLSVLLKSVISRPVVRPR